MIFQAHWLENTGIDNICLYHHQSHCTCRLADVSCRWPLVDFFRWGQIIRFCKKSRRPIEVNNRNTSFSFTALPACIHLLNQSTSRIQWSEDPQETLTSRDVRKSFSSCRLDSILLLRLKGASVGSKRDVGQLGPGLTACRFLI